MSDSDNVCVVTRNDGWPIVVAWSESAAKTHIEEETKHNVYDVCFFEEDSDGFTSLI